jgi:RNA polymerase sigma factor (sigma-70 family)
MAAFATTNWSQVLAARDGSDTEAQKALAGLCESYWSPLYAYVRRQGHDVDEARDLTQTYFTQLLEKDYLQNVKPSAGRFRSFLLSSLRHFLSHEWEKARAQKRGGDTRTISFDTDDAELRYGWEPTDHLTPEQIFERRWALTVVERTLERLRLAAIETDTPQRYELLKPHLTGVEPRKSYRDVATELGVSEGTIKVAVHNLRHKFGRILRAEIAETVADPGEVEDEMRCLLQVLGPSKPQPA